MVMKAGVNNRSVMLLDVLGCTRATMIDEICLFKMEMFTNHTKFGVLGIEFCYYYSLTRNVL